MCGDFGNDFFFILASSFLMVFYTNVLGIPGALVGTLFLVSRCVDAFTDIGMGRIVDKSKPNAAGRYRPWIKRMMLPVVAAGVMMFVPWVAHLPYTFRIVYIFVTYILWEASATLESTFLTVRWHRRSRINQESALCFRHSARSAHR